MKFNVPEVATEISSQMTSPSLVIFRDRVVQNLEKMIQVAGGVERLRPHCKTHKMAAVTDLLLDRGISKHKAATIAEAEMLFDAGAVDVLMAYNPVGPNIHRCVELAGKFGDRLFSVTADHKGPLQSLSSVAAAADVELGVMLDVNVGQNRTGVAVDDARAVELYRMINEFPGLRLAGFHVYDGHQRHGCIEDRSAAVMQQWEKVQKLRTACESAGLHVPAIVCGGTPTFPVYANINDAAVQLSPGTCIFHDTGYGSQFPDLVFQNAAAVISRVVSRPCENRATLDLGNKAIAADPPKGHRVYFPEFPDAVQDIHNEEHLVVESPLVNNLQPGDVVWGIPVHICPTSALYEKVYVVDEGQLLEPWTVTSRNRKITI